MTISEFFHSEQALAVACPTEDRAKKLLQRFDAHRYRWRNGMRYVRDNLWHRYQEQACYSNRHEFGSRSYYETHEYTIIQYETLTDDADDAPALGFRFNFE